MDLHVLMIPEGHRAIPEVCTLENVKTKGKHLITENRMFISYIWQSKIHSGAESPEELRTWNKNKRKGKWRSKSEKKWQTISNYNSKISEKE